MLHPPSDRTRERIINMGSAGTGKSYAYLTIARLAAKTQSDAIFYVIDTDVSLDRLLTTEFTDVDAYGNVTGIDVADWTELTDAITNVMGKMRQKDWLMIDLLSPSWEMVQQFFTEAVFKKSKDQYFLQARIDMEAKRNKSADTFEGWRDWQYINGLYKDNVQNKLLRCPGQLYCTSEVKALARETATKETVALFGPHGVQPVGQKRTPHIFQTVLWSQMPRVSQYAVVSIKDRGRPDIAPGPIKDFALDYLIKVAGWKL